MSSHISFATFTRQPVLDTSTNPPTNASANSQTSFRRIKKNDEDKTSSGLPKASPLTQGVDTNVSQSSATVLAEKSNGIPLPTVVQPHKTEKEQKEGENKKKNELPTQTLTPNSKKEDQFRTLGRYALAVANAGIFAQNMVSVLRTPVLDPVPQSFNVLGSLINLASCFVAPVARLPMFVAGTSLFMGGSALSQSHMDQVNVSQMSKASESFFQAVEGSKWDSSKEFPHPAYLRPMSDQAKAHYAEYLAKKQSSKIMPNAKKGDYKGFMHMAHPGSMATLARNKYYETYFPLMDAWMPAFEKLPLPEMIKYTIPSFTASSIAGAKQLGWMVGKMATDWRFAHDALMFTTRREILKGTNITMPNSVSYVLAIGSVLPLMMLSAAMLAEGGKQAYKHSHKKDDAKNPQNMTANESVDQPSNANKEEPFVKKHSNTVELVANASSIIPQVANLMFLMTIMNEGNGNLIHTHPIGLKLDHAITPRLNAALVGTGSVGALLSALVAVGSDLSLAPRYVAYLANIAFMAFSGITTAGLARNLFEGGFNNQQIKNLFPTPNGILHARQVAEARFKGYEQRIAKGRFPQNTPMSQLEKEAQAFSDTSKKKP